MEPFFHMREQHLVDVGVAALAVRLCQASSARTRSAGASPRSSLCRGLDASMGLCGLFAVCRSTYAKPHRGAGLHSEPGHWSPPQLMGTGPPEPAGRHESTATEAAD